MKKLQTTVTAAILATALAGSAFAAGTGTGAPSNSSSTNANSSATDSTNTNTGAVVPGSTDQNGNQVNGANSSTQPYPPTNMAQPKTDSTGIAKGH